MNILQFPREDEGMLGRAYFSRYRSNVRVWGGISLMVLALVLSFFWATALFGMLDYGFDHGYLSFLRVR